MKKPLIIALTLILLGGLGYFGWHWWYYSEATYPDAFLLELEEVATIPGKGGFTSKQEFLFNPPNQWHFVNDIFGVKHISICDGTTCWSWLEQGERTAGQNEYNFKRLEEALGAGEARSLLLALTTGTQLEPFANPVTDQRREIPVDPDHAKDLKPLGEEKAGDVACLKYQFTLGRDARTRVTYWFDKEDGLIRRVVYRADDAVITTTTKKVTIGQRFSAVRAFAASFPSGSSVANKTEEILSSRRERGKGTK
jgi:hypothetical protein